MVLITIARKVVGHMVDVLTAVVRLHHDAPEFDLRPVKPTPEIEAQIRSSIERHPAGHMRSVDVLTTDIDYVAKREAIIAARKSQGYVTPDPQMLSRYLQERQGGPE